MDKQIAQIKEKISNSEKIVITAHRQPDPDALCSTLALQIWLRTNYPNKEVKILFEDDFAFDSFDYIPNIQNIKQTKDLTKEVDEDTTLIVLDSPALYRNTEFENNLKAKDIIIIDHHPEIDTPNVLKYTNVNTSSACEIISSQFCTDEDLKNEILCEILIQGILADSGGITFIGVRNSSALTEMKRLIDAGNIDQIENLTSKSFIIFEEQLEVYKVYIKNMTNITLPNGPNLTYTYLTNEEYNALNPDFIKPARGQIYFDTIRRIKDHPWGFVVTPDPEKNKFGIGFRAKVGAVDVLKIAKQLDGGGHKMAAGGNYFPTEEEQKNKIDTPEVINKILELIKTMDLTNY